MNDESKIHAKDYLIDFSTKQSAWLRLLIIESINTNGKISDDRLDEIYSCLKNEAEIQIPPLNIRSARNSLKITLNKLEHLSGVNALAIDQIIKFSDDITILYGLNGAGKSSYFKVLNEIVGGNERKEILPDIHANQPEPIQVNLTFNNGNSNELFFDNSSRGNEALAGCKVFDSSYLSGLLSQRTQDETVLEPLGLHLFKYIADGIDDFKRRLKKDADQLKSSKPAISCDNFSDQLKGEFEAHNVSEKTINLLNKKFVFTDEKTQQLREKKRELATLQQTNYTDRIALLNTENQEIRKIYDFLKKKMELEAQAGEIQKKLIERDGKEDANQDALKKILILQELPFSATTEWKDFISAGARLTDKSHTDSNICIYCNQPLQNDAIKLVQAYAEYLGDKTETELQTAKLNLVNARSQIDAISVSLDISDSFKQKYNESFLEQDQILITTALDDAHKSIADYKSYLLGLIDGKKDERPNIEVSTTLCLWLVSKFRENARTISSLEADDTQKNQKIETLENELKKLMENKSISAQTAEIKTWLEVSQAERLLREKEADISTNSVTRLSNTAHGKLLTSELNRTFKGELEHLGYKSLEVDLVKAGGGKGANSTKLILKEKDSIHSILSEGEQKAVGLALFIAEAAVQKSQAPIILDDPVNSLDHKIAANFANRLLSLDNQLIVFNHNRLFQDSFQRPKGGHICTTIDSACNKKGKHILVYNVSSESKSRKGVIGFYRNNTFTNHISDAKGELTKSPFTEHSKVSALLRKAVECLIDETILNGVTPTKYSNKNNRIPWDKLKELKCSTEDIEKVRKVHGRVSGGDLHNGTESENNPIDVDEYNQLVTDLESVVGGDTHT